MILYTNSPSETEELGRRLGSLLKQGAFIALFGDLGGGKTCFTRGIVAVAAPQSSHLVASPTFAIMNEYPGAVPVYHFDFYRLGTAHEIEELGFDDYFQGEGICIAEWSERLADLLPKDALRVTFEYCGDDRRKVTLAAGSTLGQALINQLGQRIKPEEFL